MAIVRRLLESDLGLKASSLDSHKAFIRQLVDEALLSPEKAADQEEEKAASEVEKGFASPTKLSKVGSSLKRLKKSTGRKPREEPVLEELRSEDSQSEDDLHMEAPRKKKQTQQEEKRERPRRKEIDEDADDGSHVEVSEDGSDVTEAKKKKKKIKQEGKKAIACIEEMDADAVDDNDGRHGETSEEGEEEKVHSREEMDEDKDDGSNGEVPEEGSDIKEPKKPKKVKAAAVKSVTIDHLKKTIKECGLGIPPNIYRKAKQLPDHKQEAFIIRGLEDILSRHGLSSNPTEKEIKTAKWRIARDKDLEGIDMSNIITEPRGRRAAASPFFAQAYKPPPVEYDSEEDNGSAEDGEEGSEDDEGGEGEEEVEAEESEGGEKREEEGEAEEGD